VNSLSATSIQFYDYHPEPIDFFSEVINGLTSKFKFIPPKFFYDERGSQLFEKICNTPEYYPTRTEQKILTDNAEDIAQIIGHNCLLIELGSGNCEKVRLLLDTLRPAAYVPVDISKDHLCKAANALSKDYPWLDVVAACIDFTQPLDLAFCPDHSRKIAFFPGSSIGNFEPDAAIKLMSQIKESVGPGGGLLIGIDVKKQKDILDNAYNDNDGMTAAFNLNVLTRINQELDAGFELSAFEHHAFYNKDEGRVEMHLRSKAEQVIDIRGQSITFFNNETIHTESSYKYSIKEFQKLAIDAGFIPTNVWSDTENLFSVHYLEVPA
jgi:dimethylhistidine N-methyltransferase